MLFEHQPKIAKKKAKKTITFHILQNTGGQKNPFCCNPPLDQNFVFFFLVVCFETQNIDVEQKT